MKKTEPAQQRETQRARLLQYIAILSSPEATGAERDRAEKDLYRELKRLLWEKEILETNQRGEKLNQKRAEKNNNHLFAENERLKDEILKLKRQLEKKDSNGYTAKQGDDTDHRDTNVIRLPAPTLKRRIQMVWRNASWTVTKKTQHLKPVRQMTMDQQAAQTYAALPYAGLSVWAEKALDRIAPSTTVAYDTYKTSALFNSRLHYTLIAASAVVCATLFYTQDQGNTRSFNEGHAPLPRTQPIQQWLEATPYLPSQAPQQELRAAQFTGPAKSPDVSLKMAPPLRKRDRHPRSPLPKPLESRF